MRSMKVHEPIANSGQNTQTRGRSIDELFIATGIGESAFQDELIFFARFQTVGFEKISKRRLKSGNIEDSFDHATFTAAPYQCPVGSLAKHQAQRAYDNAFARAGFARNDVIASL